MRSLLLRLAGGLSRTLAAVAACPITLVKTRMEYVGAGGHAYRGTLHALGEIWRADGLRGMYRGIGPTALSQAPFSALYYMFYTQLQAGGLPWGAMRRVTAPPLALQSAAAPQPVTAASRAIVRGPMQRPPGLLRVPQPASRPLHRCVVHSRDADMGLQVGCLASHRFARCAMTCAAPAPPCRTSSKVASGRAWPSTLCRGRWRVWRPPC